MRVVAPALVAVRMAAPLAVEHPHHASAAAAPHEAGEQARPPRPVWRAARRFTWAFSSSIRWLSSNRSQSM